MKRILFTAVLMGTLCTIGLTQSTQTPDRTEGARVDTIRIDGGLKTHGSQILPLEQLGSIRNLVLTGGCSRDDTNK